LEPSARKVRPWRLCDILLCVTNLWWRRAGPAGWLRCFEAVVKTYCKGCAHWNRMDDGLAHLRVRQAAGVLSMRHVEPPGPLVVAVSVLGLAGTDLEVKQAVCRVLSEDPPAVLLLMEALQSCTRDAALDVGAVNAACCLVGVLLTERFPQLAGMVAEAVCADDFRVLHAIKTRLRVLSVSDTTLEVWLTAVRELLWAPAFPEATPSIYACCLTMAYWYVSLGPAACGAPVFCVAVSVLRKACGAGTINVRDGVARNQAVADAVLPNLASLVQSATDALRFAELAASRGVADKRGHVQDLLRAAGQLVDIVEACVSVKQCDPCTAPVLADKVYEWLQAMGDVAPMLCGTTDWVVDACKLVAFVSVHLDVSNRCASTLATFFNRVRIALLTARPPAQHSSNVSQCPGSPAAVLSQQLKTALVSCRYPSASWLWHCAVTFATVCPMPRS
jgi:hypothetical protein